MSDVANAAVDAKHERAQSVGAPPDAPRISGEIVRQALLGEAEVPADSPLMLDRRGARLEGVILEDELDLSTVKFDRPISFTHCTFERPIRLRRARFADLSLIACRAPIIDAQYADIEGDLEFSDSSLGDCEGFALDARHTRISGDVKFNRCIATGPVSFNNAFLAGNFWCLDSTLQCPTHESGRMAGTDR